MKKPSHKPASALALLWMLGAPLAAAAEDHVVTQKDKAFSVTELRAKVGDRLIFRNEDPFVHNIFSLSDVQAFDLGTFSQGEAREVSIAAPGRLEIECAVHPDMRLVVEVSE